MSDTQHNSERMNNPFFDRFLNLLTDNFNRSIAEVKEQITEMRLHQEKTDEKITDLSNSIVLLAGRKCSDDCKHDEIMAKLEKKNTTVEILLKVWPLLAIGLMYFVIVGVRKWETMAAEEAQHQQKQKTETNK
jgi:hypothetical protein